MMMKSYIFGILFFMFTLGLKAQDQEVKQLLLNVEKLDQLRNILEQMKAKYQILAQGYQQIQQINQESFEIHSLFLDRLVKVNPQVRRYYKIAEILGMQVRLFEGMKQEVRGLNLNEMIVGEELQYLEKAFSGFRKNSWNNLEEMALILSDNQLQLTDSERIKGIDRIHLNMNRLLEDFNSLSLTMDQIGKNRKYQQGDLKSLKSILNYD
jgi:hypothetical protein